MNRYQPYGQELISFRSCTLDSSPDITFSNHYETEERSNFHSLRSG